MSAKPCICCRSCPGSLECCTGAHVVSYRLSVDQGDQATDDVVSALSYRSPLHLFTPSLFPSLSSPPFPFSVRQPLRLSPEPCETSVLSPMVSISARSPSVSTSSLWLIRVVSVESHTSPGMIVHPAHGP